MAFRVLSRCDSILTLRGSNKNLYNITYSSFHAVWPSFFADQLNLAITIHISIAPSMICQQIIALGTGRI